MVPERPSDPGLWARLSEICNELPDVEQTTSHGELAWKVGRGRSARQFATTWDHHHGDRNAVLFAAAPGVQGSLIAGDPEHYFSPPYVGGRGWVGYYLDVAPVDWDVVELHLTDAHEYILATGRPPARG